MARRRQFSFRRPGNASKWLPGSLLERVFGVGLEMFQNAFLETSWREFSASAWKCFKMLRKPSVLHGFLRPMLRKPYVLRGFLRPMLRKPYVLRGFLRPKLRNPCVLHGFLLTYITKSKCQWYQHHLICGCRCMSVPAPVCCCLCVSVLACGCLCLSVAICACLCLSVAVCGCLWLSVKHP